MKRAPALVAVVLAASGGAAVLAVSAGGQVPTGPLADFTVQTTTRERDVAFVNNPPRRRQGRGDMFMGTGRIAGAKSGTFEFTCTGVSRRSLVCQGIASFSDGEIHLSARIAGEGDTLVAAIVGGTGAYSGASGTLTQTTVSQRRNVDVTEDVYDFVP